MRAVLIIIPERPGWLRDGPRPSHRGRPLPLRQLDFALACGCRTVLLAGDVASARGELLRREARLQGVPLHVADDAHGLLGRLNTADELLVLAPGLLPESRDPLATLAEGAGVLVLPAELAVPAGFERIDRDRAWAGVALLPGGLIERLAELPRDSDPASALLRIALQTHVPERPLPPAVLAQGGWGMIAPGAAPPAAAEGWRRQLLTRAAPHELTCTVAQAILTRWPDALPPERHLAHGLYAGSALLLAIAVVVAWYGWPAIGLAVLAPAGLTAALGWLLARIAAGPFGRKPARWTPSRLLGYALDAALLVCAALAIEGDALGRLFPPAVLLLALHLRPGRERPLRLAQLGDRVVVAPLLALAAVLGLAEPTIMLLALAFLVVDRFGGSAAPE